MSTWRLTLVRRGEAFTDREQALSQILLQQWHCRFMKPEEVRMGRLLLLEDFSVLATDLSAQAWSVDEVLGMENLLRAVSRVLKQRFDQLVDDEAYECIVADGDLTVWVKLRFRSSGLPHQGRHAYAELRLLDTDEVPVLTHVEDERLARAIGHIDQQYAQSPDLTEMAKVACMSPFHFHRTFSVQAGVSPKQYVVLRQLQVARWLLRTRDVPIADVAERCGFCSHGHFTATFHRMTGIKPSVFRDQHRHDLP